VKNVFVLAPIVFAAPTLFGDGEPPEIGLVVETAGTALLAFAAFCLLSSGFYCINDVFDADEDRMHPIKRHRPVAAGEIPRRTALVLGVVLVAAGVMLGAVVNWSLAIVALAYAALQVLYNVGLKRAMLVDVVAVAIGFGLRAAAGAVAIDVRVSVWLLLCVFFLCLYLGFVKRLFDLSSAEAGGAADWTQPAGYEDRILLGVSATLSVVTFLMYALSDHAQSIFGTRALGFALLTPLVVIAIHRFYARASKGRSDSPLRALVEDRAVLASIVLFAAGTFATLYAPGVDRALEAVFYVTEQTIAP
ncbi:MAG: UbiA prenyltransferase family protein, partial [Planctomycetota bacterium]|jgi:4-hydroxybenzoate polyprenyltransferase